jgi:hypothetical protein
MSKNTGPLLSTYIVSVLDKTAPPAEGQAMHG